MISALLLAATACTWAHPGTNRFTGTDAVVEHYKDIPAAVRAALRARMQRHDYDDIATISRDSVAGKAEYDDLRAMHFGASRLCNGPVTRPWAADHREQGLVYCEGEHCVIVPSVCGNIARVTRRSGGGTPMAQAAGGGGAPAAQPVPPALPSLDDMDPTGAGVRSAEPPGSFAQALSVPNNTVPLASPLTTYPVLWPGQGIGFGSGGLLSPVPEPASWLSLMAGLAAIGGALRRARSVG